jgi:hypothetical protein
MRLLQSVALETPANYGVLHRHPYCARLIMTSRAVTDYGTVSRMVQGDRTVVPDVSETQIPRPRARGWLPLDSRLDDSIMTRRAANRFRVNGLACFGDSGVTGRA